MIKKIKKCLYIYLYIIYKNDLIYKHEIKKLMMRIPSGRVLIVGFELRTIQPSLFWNSHYGMNAT